MAVEKFGLKRVLIVDWDVHAAQGTQYVIRGDPRVLLISLHRFSGGTFWPNLPESNWDVTENTINVPLNHTGMGDAEFMFILHNLILPAAIEFKPELILISAGYDTAIGDPQGEMLFSPLSYAHAARLLKTSVPSTKGRVCAIYEGGYFVPSVELAVAMTVIGLRDFSVEGLPPLVTASGQVHNDVVNTVWQIANKRQYSMTSSESSMRLYEYASKSDKFCTDNIWKPMRIAPFRGLREMDIPYPIVGLYPPLSPEAREHFDRMLDGDRKLLHLMLHDEQRLERSDSSGGLQVNFVTISTSGGKEPQHTATAANTDIWLITVFINDDGNSDKDHAFETDVNKKRLTLQINPTMADFDFVFCRVLLPFLYALLPQKVIAPPCSNGFSTAFRNVFLWRIKGIFECEMQACDEPSACVEDAASVSDLAVKNVLAAWEGLQWHFQTFAFWKFICGKS